MNKHHPDKKLIMKRRRCFFFCGGVSAEQQEGGLIGALNMRIVDRHKKYLGLPTVVERSKKAMFGGLMDRIWKKLQG